MGTSAIELRPIVGATVSGVAAAAADDDDDDGYRMNNSLEISSIDVDVVSATSLPSSSKSQTLGRCDCHQQTSCEEEVSVHDPGSLRTHTDIARDDFMDTILLECIRKRNVPSFIIERDDIDVGEHYFQ